MIAFSLTIPSKRCDLDHGSGKAALSADLIVMNPDSIS